MKAHLPSLVCNSLWAGYVSATSLYVYIDPLIMCRVSAFRLPDTVLGVVSDYVISLLVAIQLLQVEPVLI